MCVSLKNGMGLRTKRKIGYCSVDNCVRTLLCHASVNCRQRWNGVVFDFCLAHFPLVRLISTRASSRVLTLLTTDDRERRCCNWNGRRVSRGLTVDRWRVSAGYQPRQNRSYYWSCSHQFLVSSKGMTDRKYRTWRNEVNVHVGVLVPVYHGMFASMLMSV